MKVSRALPACLLAAFPLACEPPSYMQPVVTSPLASPSRVTFNLKNGSREEDAYAELPVATCFRMMDVEERAQVNMRFSWVKSIRRVLVRLELSGYSLSAPWFYWGLEDFSRHYRPFLSTQNNAFMEDNYAAHALVANARRYSLSDEEFANRMVRATERDFLPESSGPNCSVNVSDASLQDLHAFAQYISENRNHIETVRLSDAEVESEQKKVADAKDQELAGSFARLLGNTGEASTFEMLLDHGGSAALPYRQGATLFAPSDDAFRRLGNGFVEALLKDPTALSEFVRSHAASQQLFSWTLMKTKSVTTLTGSELHVSITPDGKTTTVGGAKIITTDVSCNDGVIHVLDTVIMPPVKKAAAPAKPATPAKK